jgi:hypothetical protein
MAQPVLDHPQWESPVHHVVPAGVTERVRLDMWTEASSTASSLDDLEIAVLAHPAAALVLEDWTVGLGSKLLERGNLITLHGVIAAMTSLAPQDHHFLASEIELLPFEHRDQLMGPHSMSVREQAHGHVPVPMTADHARLLDESFDICPLEVSFLSDG